MSGARRVVASSVGSYFLASACATPFSRIAWRARSVCRKVGIDASYIEIFMSVFSRGPVRERDYRCAPASAITRICVTIEVTFNATLGSAVGRPLQRILRPRHSRIHAQQASARQECQAEA